MKNLYIGKIKVKNRLFLAPLLEVTDLAYRLVCRSAGAGMAYTEMINFGAIIHENKSTKDKIKTIEKDRPLGIQITGNSIEDLKKIIPLLKKYDMVDLNCGCPSDRIIKNSSGSYLLNNPKRIGEMISLLKKEGLTASAKIRLGFSKINVLEIAKEIEKAGADALIVHARLANQGYNVPADWSWIARVKKEIKIPVIGNGDIDSPKKAKEMLKIADGAMIGRAAIGDPGIFQRSIHYLKTNELIDFNFNENIKYFKQYLNFVKKYDLINLHKIKFLGANFINNIHYAAKHRAYLMGLKSIDEIDNFLDKIK